jgi:hypothetical protein
VRDDGATNEIIGAYLSSGLSASTAPGSSSDGGPIRLRSVTATGVGDPADRARMREDPVRLSASFDVIEELSGVTLSFFITNKDGSRVLDKSLVDNSEVRLTAGHHEPSMCRPY